MLETLGNLIIQFISSSGYLGVFVLMTLESALIPIPSEVTMTFSGFLSTTGVFNFWAVVIVGTLANLVGSLLAYGLGYLGEEKIPKVFRNKEYHHAVSLFNKYGEMITFASRMLPAIRTYISLPAGIARMDLKKFIIYTTVGSFLWSLILTYLGVLLGQNWHSLSSYFHKFDLLIIISVVIITAIYFLKKLNKNGKFGKAISKKG